MYTHTHTHTHKISTFAFFMVEFSACVCVYSACLPRRGFQSTRIIHLWHLFFLIQSPFKLWIHGLFFGIAEHLQFVGWHFYLTGWANCMGTDTHAHRTGINKLSITHGLQTNVLLETNVWMDEWKKGNTNKIPEYHSEIVQHPHRVCCRDCVCVRTCVKKVHLSPCHQPSHDWNKIWNTLEILPVTVHWTHTHTHTGKLKSIQASKNGNMRPDWEVNNTTHRM